TAVPDQRGRRSRRLSFLRRVGPFGRRPDHAACRDGAAGLCGTATLGWRVSLESSHWRCRWFALRTVCRTDEGEGFREDGNAGRSERAERVSDRGEREDAGLLGDLQ